MAGRTVWACALAGALVACGGGAKAKHAAGGGQAGGGGTQQPPPPPPIPPPVVLGDWTFWGAEQGLSPGVQDVSADEAGNVYVAAGDAVYAKTRAAQDFTRFDPAAAGLTQSCHDPSEIAVASPTSPAATCPIISVAGTTAGKAVIGFKGVGTDSDHDAMWALKSGGADVLSFDGTRLTRDRHVLVASPPHTMCEHWLDPPANTQCAPGDFTWVVGRMKLRQVQRIVANHDRSRAVSYGDVYMGGTHATFTVLAANPQQRNMIDYTGGDPAWADTRWVWEHHHPALDWPDGRFLTGEAWAIAVDPLSGIPFFANQFRIASLPDYVQRRQPTWNDWWGEMVPPLPFLAIWEDPSSPDDASLRDNVSSMSFCDDGTLWVASENHGLARVTIDRGALLSSGAASAFSVQKVGIPSGGGALAVACDLDGSVWVGFDWGGAARLKDGTWTPIPTGAPLFATSDPVRSIQIDRWSTPRVVYLAHVSSQKFGPGGISAYAGP